MRLPIVNTNVKMLALRLVLARLRTAYDQLAAEKLLVVQLRDCAFRFVDGLHLDKGETFRALIVAITHHFRVLHVADAVEELEEIADRWQMARQDVDQLPVACDVQQKVHDTCRGWDDFSNEQLSTFLHELTGRDVAVPAE